MVIFFLFRSAAEGLPNDAESHFHVCDIALLSVVRIVPGTSLHGQSQALPAEGGNDSVQLPASGAVDIHRL